MQARLVLTNPRLHSFVFCIQEQLSFAKMFWAIDFWSFEQKPTIHFILCWSAVLFGKAIFQSESYLFSFIFGNCIGWSQTKSTKGLRCRIECFIHSFTGGGNNVVLRLSSCTVDVSFQKTIFVSCSDVNFIASPPSMVAAGSVVAAVQGLYLKTQDASLSSQNLTNFLSQVIRSDPVCKHMLLPNPFNTSHWMLPWSVWQQVLCLLKPIACFQDCLRACQEQIESLLELNLRQAQQHSGTTEPKRVDGEVDLSCTPTDVRDVNIWNDWPPCRTMTWSPRRSCERGAWWEGRCCHWDASHTAAVLFDCQANGRLPCNKNPGHISCQCPLPSWEKK